MTTLEKIADDLGQATFRIEANLETLRLSFVRAGSLRARPLDETVRAELTAALGRDIERLKEIKSRMLAEPEQDAVLARN